MKKVNKLQIKYNQMMWKDKKFWIIALKDYV